MSHSFINCIFRGIKYIFEKGGAGEIAARVSLLTPIVIGHGIYAYSTEKSDAIIVTKKYKMTRNGFTDFMIVDDKGRHFNVNNSLWYWKWDSIEEWHKIEENPENKLFIKYYGLRMPLLGTFPNITLSNKSAFLDSMSSAKFRRFEHEKLI
jgi:hypothetical protein